METTEKKPSIKQGAALGGWICFLIASAIMFVPAPTWFIYAPLFLASAILSVVAMAQRRIASGIMLLLANIIGIPIMIGMVAAIKLKAVKLEQDRIAAEHLMDKSRTSNVATNNVEAQTTPPPVTSDTTPPAKPQPAPAAQAFEKIEGAFGKKLGDVFDPTDAIGTSSLTDGTPMYAFSTPNGFRAFKNYYVMVTPTTHKIYCIWASGHVENTQAGRKEQAVIMELLTQKYGTPDKTGAFDTLGDVKRITYGNRYILTKISGFTDVTIDIRYYDRKLEKLAEQERLANEVKKVDKTGL